MSSRRRKPTPEPLEGLVLQEVSELGLRQWRIEYLWCSEPYLWEGDDEAEARRTLKRIRASRYTTGAELFVRYVSPWEEA